MNNKNFLYLKKELSKIDSFFKKKEFDTAIKKSKILLKKNPNQAIVYNYIALSYFELDKTENALEFLLLANEKLSSETSILCNIGIAYKKLGELIKARNYFYKVLKLNPKHLPSHINLGHLEGGLNHSDQATKHYSDAYNLNNNVEDVLIYSILNLSSLGKFTEAKKIIYELNSKFPKNTKSYQLFSKIHKYEINDNHQQVLLDKIEDRSLDNEDLSNLYFALAKSYFDQKNIEKFVEYTLKANETKYKTFNDYNFEPQENKIKRIINYFNDFQFQEEGNRKGENLIFIVGLPRSGTTLLHQIISAHSKVFGAEESNILGDFFKSKFLDDASFDNFSK
jgi:tetratricopeptide (TPR) repeat protein